MKLHNYFIQQSQQQLPDKDKFSLYQRILTKRDAESKKLGRILLLQKKIIYPFLAALLIFVFFGSSVWDGFNVRQYRAFFAQNTGRFNTASAGQVATILTINGDYVIEKDGKQFQNSVLFNGDLITLKDNAKIIFNITGTTQVEIQGPAQFIINKKEMGGYLLKLIDGHFLRLNAQNQEEVIEVTTPTLSIQTPIHQSSAFELTKIDNTLQLKNTGAPLLVKTHSDTQKNQTTQELSNAKILTMLENDITKIEDIKTLTQTLANNTLTHTHHTSGYASGRHEEQALFEEIGTLISMETSPQTHGDTNTIKADMVNAINTSLDYQSDEKYIPTEDQLSQISAALNGKFLLNDMSQLYTAKLNLDESTLTQISYLLESKLKNIAKIYTISLPSENMSLIQLIDEVIKGLNNYHLPPSKITQLKTLKNWLIFLVDQPLEDWDSFKTQLPRHLIFQ